MGMENKMSITNDEEDRSKVTADFDNGYKVITKFDTEDDAHRAMLLLKSVVSELDK